MILQASNISLSYDELELLFNNKLQKEIENWQKEKDLYINNIIKGIERTTGNFMPDTVFQFYIDVEPSIVSTEILDKLRFNIEAADWKVNTLQFMFDEKTHSTKLVIEITK